MNLAIVIVHNKTDLENVEQINTIDSLLTKITDTHILHKKNGEIEKTFYTYHYEFKEIPDAQVKIYQIVPYGVPIPSNFDLLDSHKVIYGAGDEDKTGDHPRFFNWGLKRATDYGADLVLHWDGKTSIDILELKKQIPQLIDKYNKKEYLESNFGQITTAKLLETVGQLQENGSKHQALLEYKNAMNTQGIEQIDTKGVKNG